MIILLETFRALSTITLMESCRVSILHLLIRLFRDPPQAQKLLINAAQSTMVTFMHLSPGSIQPAVHTIHTRLGGPSPLSLGQVRLCQRPVGARQKYGDHTQARLGQVRLRWARLSIGPPTGVRQTVGEVTIRSLRTLKLSNRMSFRTLKISKRVSNRALKLCNRVLIILEP